MIQHVACVGAGFVGGPLAAMIAWKCPSVRVSVIDKDPDRVRAWQLDAPSFHEPGLLDILACIRQRAQASAAPSNLTFTIDAAAVLRDADTIFLCVDTPTKTFGTGSGCAPDLTSLQNAARMIAQAATGHKIVVEKSTIPCGTSEMLRDLLHEASDDPHAHFQVLSNPEFLAEGTAIRDLLSPSRVLIGSQQTPAGRDAAASLAALYQAWIPSSLILMMDCWSSELAKLAANAMLAQRVSNINSLSAICETTGANIDSVAEACGLDPRIGPHMLQSGLGWGGGCFQKDILDLVYIARSLKLDHVADYWASVIDINVYQQERFVRRIIAAMYGSVAGRSIAVLGFAFKKDTSDSKNSPAMALVRGLLEERANVSIYDPLVPPTSVISALQLTGDAAFRVRVCASPYEACHEADAVIVATECAEFATPSSPPPKRDGEVALPLTPPQEKSQALDWAHIASHMRRPRYVFDGRNLLDGEYLAQLGCRYARVGRASVWDGRRSDEYRA